jgi:two-component sensor histidine kinase
VGFPGDINFPETESIGMQLVKGLVDQIKGTLEMKNGSQGTEVIIEFRNH